MVKYSHPTFGFPRFDAALDAIIAKFKARKSKHGPRVYVTNIHVGLDVDLCIVIRDVLSNFIEVENTKTILEDVAKNVTKIFNDSALGRHVEECSNNSACS